MTRTERKLSRLQSECASLMTRIQKKTDQHKSSKDLLGRLVAAKAEQIRVEMRLEKRRG